MDFLDNVDWGGLLGRALAAIAILVVTWLVALLVKSALTKLTNTVPALQRAGTDGASIGSTIGSIGSLVVWLLGLTAILQVLGLTQVLSPIQSLLGGVLGFLPNLIGAIIVFVIGALVAKVVRQLVETALAAVPFEKWLRKAGDTASNLPGSPTARTTGGTPPPPPPPPAGQPASPTGQPAAPTGQPAAPTGQQGYGGTTAAQSGAASIPKTIATVLYALIMIVVTIAALQILGIEAISQPAQQMLQAILTAIPLIIAAGLMLALGVLIARFVGDILGQVLEGVGVERQVASSGVLPEETKVVPIIVTIAQIGIVLFFAVAAAQLLNFPQITSFLSEVLELGGSVLFGGAIIGAGFFIAHVLAGMFSGVGAQIVRYTTIILFVAMGLKFMGIADSIIELGFGALVVGGAAAAALAFGLGGRDAAARQLDKLQARAEASSARPDSQSGPGDPRL